MSDERSANKIDKEIVENRLPKLVQVLESCMDFDRWGFVQSFSGIGTEFPPSVVYDSEYCRVRFIWHKGDPRDGYDTLDVLYGRLHAPNNWRVMDWRGRKSHAWHDIGLILDFLDELSPQEAFDTRHKWPNVMDQFVQTTVSKDMSFIEPHIEWKVKLHAHVWRHYGFRLFKFFDLSEQKQWTQYETFIREFYRIAPLAYNRHNPKYEYVC